jgi:hypothetical protein
LRDYYRKALQGGLVGKFAFYRHLSQEKSPLKPLSGQWSPIMQTLVEFFGTLSASAAVAAIIQFWFKKRLQASIDHEYNLAIERHKAELSRQNAIEIEQIKHDYNLSLEEFKAKFSQELEKTKSMYNNGAVARKSVYDAFSALYSYCPEMDDIYISEYCPEHEHHIDDYRRCFNQTNGVLKELKYSSAMRLVT